MPTGYTTNLNLFMPADGHNDWGEDDTEGINDNFDILDALFGASAGHTHDGTSGDGTKIDAGDLVANDVTLHSILPEADNTRNLGSGTYRFSTAYVVTLSDNTDSLTVAQAKAAYDHSQAVHTFVRDDISDVKLGDLNMHSGADLKIYSDAGSTAEFAVDGSTGTVYVGGSVTVDSDILPYADNSSDLGVSGGSFKDLWLAGDIRIGGSLIDGSDEVTVAEAKAGYTHSQVSHAPMDTYILLQDQKAAGTHGGASSALTWNVRDITTEVVDEPAAASIASNQVTLAAGTYHCRISAPAWAVAYHQLRLHETTGTLTDIVGSAEQTSTGVIQTRATLVGKFVISSANESAGQNIFEVQHYTSTAVVSSGLGYGYDNGVIEVYTIVEFWKVA